MTHIPILAAAGLAFMLGLARHTPAAEPATGPVPENPLATLRTQHPRLILRPDSIEMLRRRIESDDLARRIYASLRKEAAGLLDKPVSTYEIPDGKRLLSVSRRVMDRVRVLALVRLVENDRRYAARAWRELDAAAGFKDWNPSHFLDTAEMTHAFALGYDWLYDDWSEEQRTRLADAILRLGLQPALNAYRTGAWWVTCNHNWNQVCHGGLGMGALAVAERYPAEAGEVLRQALANLPRAMQAYGPDGAGEEGPTYWSYGCGYNVLILDGLVTALGTEFGLSSIPGFGKSGSYQIYLSGADGIAFDFADCGRRRVSAPAHWWMAARYREPSFSRFRRDQLVRDPESGGVLDLLWYDDRSGDVPAAKLPLDRHFRNAECASMRSAWNDPKAVVLGIQGGDNTFNHWHLDLGTFILEALGERWIMDSGVEHETYQTHRNKQPRWSFYRIRAEGHNTLVLNPTGAARGPDQNPKGKAPIVEFTSTPEAARAVMDLTDACRGHAQSVRRTFSLLDGRRTVVVEDAVIAENPADLWWFAHTEADVKITPDGRFALLEQHGKQMTATLEEAPEGARLEVMDARPLPTSPDPSVQNRNEGRRKLFIHLPETTRAVLRVRFTPVAAIP